MTAHKPHTLSNAQRTCSSGHCWTRARRLLKRRDFTDCYDENKRFFSQHFLLFARIRTDETRDAAQWRVGFAVSKKVGNAVRRNRIKRLLREFFRVHGHILPNTLDLVVIAKKNTVGVALDLETLRCELLPVLKKITKSKYCGNCAANFKD